MILVSSIPSLGRSQYQEYEFCKLPSDLSATSLASCGWLLPVSSLIEFVAMLAASISRLRRSEVLIVVNGFKLIDVRNFVASTR